MNILELENIVRYYGRNKVLDGLCVHVPQGKIYGFLGRNGAGKTTTIRIILGLIQYHGGKVSVNGSPFSASNRSALGKIGSIVEFPGFYPNLNGHDNLKVFQWLLGQDDRHSIEHLLEVVGLSDAGNKKVGAYSLGMKQRLGLARALLNDPNILILDEPINGLDPAGIREMRKMLRSLSTEHGKTIFLSSHILSEIEQIVDMVGIIKNGKMIEEVSITALREKCRKGWIIQVSNPAHAAVFLHDQMDLLCTVDPEKSILRIEQDVDSGRLNQALVENGFTVSMLSKSSQGIEDYFLNITA